MAAVRVSKRDIAEKIAKIKQQETVDVYDKKYVTDISYSRAIAEAQLYLLDARRIRTSTQMIADDGALQPLGLGSGRLHAALA